MSTLEVVATIATIVGVVLTFKQHILVWPVSIVSVVSLILLYVSIGMFSQVVLQCMCLVTCIIGWVNWGGKDTTHINTISTYSVVCDTLLFMVLGVLFACSMSTLTNTPITMIILLDGVAAFIGLLANWYLTQKTLEAWKIFMIYNVLLIVLMYSQGLYLIVGLNVVLFLLSLNGYRVWKRDLKLV